MLNLLRRLVSSTIGKIVALIILVVIALAFAAGDISSFHNGGVSGTSVAEVGDTGISENELRDRMQNAVDEARQRQPDITMADFVQQGGVDQTLNRIINGIALEQFAQETGMHVSKRAIDGQIASIPVFQGPDGKFSQTQFDQVLKAQGLTADALRQSIRQSMLARWLVAPAGEATKVPQAFALPYASLLLENRHGLIGVVPTAAVDPGAKPSDKQLAAYYKREIGTYTIPERRVIRYAVISPSDFDQKAQPSEAEIAQAYKAAGTRFAAREERSIDQVVVADKADADKIAQKVKSGTSVKAAAQAVGLEATTISNVTKDDLAGQSSQDLANAAFAAKQGDVVGPVQSPLGYVVAKVTDVRQVAGKTLAEATPEIRQELTKQKKVELINNLQDKLDNGITDGSTFSELVSDNKLDAKQTQPVLESGIDPEHPDQKPAPELSKVFQAGFAAQQGDAPQLVQLGDDGTFAVVALGKVVPAAAKPLKAIHDRVLADYMKDQASKKARALANKAVQEINKGTDFDKALQGLKTPMPPPQKVDITRGQLAQNRQQVPPPVALIFSMKEKQAKLLEAPNESGWFVVYLDKIDKGDAKGNDALLKATRSGLSGVLGDEYAQQFIDAIRGKLGVKKNPSAIAKVQTDLGGGAPAAP
ncbi:peptidylprolyl isomerase [Stakelama marina]|uniref:Parvulin-like PPIase n=1 Tax=Stakelama marina TaxID=2826939 RepID=A0A8T4I9S3_9SPHN|nr:peptidylprolyl isomerase [Stakelama marina]MBR0551397.1 SurA N-terminal domain-containing protein [Stakelama marina]